MIEKIGEKSFLKKCEASLEAQPEKKDFISQKKQCIISRLVKSFAMSFKSNSVQVVCFSVIAFCAGVFLTCMLITAKRPDTRHGVGGLETTAVPEYSENLSSLLAEVETLPPVDADSSEIPELADITDSNIAENPADDELHITYQTYRVKSGDMIGFIADEFDVTQDTIISVNNIKQSRLIQPGQYLKIPSMPGIVYTVKKNGETPVTIAEKYKVNADKFAQVNHLTLETALNAGTSLFVPDAELDWATRQEINGDLFKKPLHARYWLSSTYGWRDSPFNAGKRTFHGGLDMAVATGTPIYAALDGTVTAVGYNATYGNYVIITHHSGYKTLYGHMKSTACRKGNFVYTNTVIGYVGSTGMSTGPHLHFTVYKNGKTINPLAVLN